MTKAQKLYLRASAQISEDGLYRYTLTRVWDSSLPVLVYVMLNPSTADGLDDDPTIRKCVGFARRLGYGGILVCNLFAWRSTDSAALLTAADPIGPVNDLVIMNCTVGVSVIAAWGNIPNKLQSRADHVREMLRRHANSVHALKLTSKNQPWHPLMAPYSLKPMELR